MATESINIREFAEGLARRAAASVGHEQADWDSLARASTTMIPWSEELGIAYAEAMQRSGPARDDAAAPAGGEEAQAFAVWYERIASGNPGESFWAETCLDGFVHASADTDTGRFVAALGRVSSLFLQKASAAFPAEQAFEVFGAFRRTLDVAAAVMTDSYVSALLRGMSQIGLNDRLLKRMRTVAIRKMVDEGRSTIPMMTWDDALSVGVGTIDDQHKRLIQLLNDLHQAKAAGKGDATLKAVLRELVEYTNTHFAFEEALFREHGYPNASEHEQGHVALKSQVVAFVEAYEAGTASLSVDLFMFLRNWLNGHIRGTDRRYAPFFAERGVR